MASDVIEKWTCSQCTYANFQTSKACTMCRTPRYSVFITEPPCTSSAVCSSEENEQRWPCPDCTYLNVLKSRHCTVCMCKRPNNFDTKDEKEFVCKGELEAFSYQYSFCLAFSKISEMSDECSIDLEQVEKLGKALHKWDCSQCTYKNWPNVKHCTMCGTPKDYVSVGIGNDITNQDSHACHSSSKDETENLRKYAEKSTEDFAGEGSEDYHGIGKTANVDTGCASFLETCAEILRQSSDAEAKLIHYIYYYGESNRRINGFESMLLNDIDEESAAAVVNRSIIDIIRSKNSRILASVPRFFMDSLSCTVAIPGLASGDSSDEIHKKIRESMYEDYDMTRVANSNALFTLPNAIYDLRPWVVSGENNLRVLMDFDDRQILDTVCCIDAHSLSGPTGCQTYAPLLLRNRGGGHSLVDAVSQALWGVVDKSNTLRDALYHTLYAMETNFRGRWATSLMKLGLNFDIWMMQRHWSNIIECNDPGFPLEQIHVLVLAQVLNRPIIVFPIESSKLNPFPLGMDVLMVGSIQLKDFTHRRVDASRPSRIYRYIRCPPYPLTEYVQFVMDAKEAEDFVKDNIVVDVDCNGQQWIYHSTFGSPHTKNDLGFLLWKDWIKAHFPKIIREDCEVQNAVAASEDSASKVGRIGGKSP
ncbi:hypothetical protein DINM_021077 [Dirofilaria immitis]|nr:hypothetical protein [Dirofilaria immitis]